MLHFLCAGWMAWSTAFAADFAGPHDLQIKKIAVAKDPVGNIVVDTTIFNAGPSFSLSGDVRLVGTKNADWASCHAVVAVGGFQAIPSGATQRVVVTMPRGNWNLANDVSLYLFIDASNFSDEPDEGRGNLLTESNNSAVIGVKQKPGVSPNVTSTTSSAFRTPACALDEVADEFTQYDAFPKIWVKAEVW